VRRWRRWEVRELGNVADVKWPYRHERASSLPLATPRIVDAKRHDGRAITGDEKVEALVIYGINGRSAPPQRLQWDRRVIGTSGEQRQTLLGAALDPIGVLRDTAGLAVDVVAGGPAETYKHQPEGFSSIGAGVIQQSGQER
jgi:hypothetical protein